MTEETQMAIQAVNKRISDLVKKVDELETDLSKHINNSSAHQP
jgi:hypothetical protein